MLLLKKESCVQRRRSYTNCRRPFSRHGHVFCPGGGCQQGACTTSCSCSPVFPHLSYRAALYAPRSSLHAPRSTPTFLLVWVHTPNLVASDISCGEVFGFAGMLKLWVQNWGPIWARWSGLSRTERKQVCYRNSSDMLWFIVIHWYVIFQ
jgi:hypothetical protein